MRATTYLMGRDLRPRGTHMTFEQWSASADHVRPVATRRAKRAARNTIRPAYRLYPCDPAYGRRAVNRLWVGATLAE